MAVNEVNIWNDSIYGIIFEGRTVNTKFPVRYISAESKIVVFSRPNAKNANGGG